MIHRKIHVYSGGAVAMKFGGDDLENDGLFTPSGVGDWGEEKYRLVGMFADLFSSAMKHKWNARIYIDLFAGAGRAKLKESGRVVRASPLLAADITVPFSQYVLCELDHRRMNALQERMNNVGVGELCTFVEGDVNANANAVISAMPRPSRDYTVLSFCFVDPYNARNLKFSTLQRIATRYVDFMVLLPTGMDLSRGWKGYVAEGNHVVDEFLGSSDWRNRYDPKIHRGRDFGMFVADEFGKRMAQMGYHDGGIPSLVPVKNSKNRAIYHLAFYSKDKKIAQKIWAASKKYSNPQGRMF